MRQFTVRLRSFQEVQSFVTLAAAQNFPIFIGNSDYRVSATSFMGMFTLDFTRPLSGIAECTEEEWTRFAQEAASFLID